jgi:hypothetical protein
MRQRTPVRPGVATLGDRLPPMSSAIRRDNARQGHAGSPLEVLRVFLKLGPTSFGGPAPHLGYSNSATRSSSSAAGSTSALLPT